ncbi:MAG: SCO family protein [Gammaproteobacteria bacterium]|nr:SCO family protein [Gammaproteobacteria bacterium]
MLFGLGMAAAVLGAAWIVGEFLKSPEKLSLVPANTRATVLHEPLGMPEFELIDQNGDRFTRDSLKEQWSFLFFGYTSCPDVCPTTINVLMEVDKTLQQKTELAKPRYIFVSIDSDRDSPENLAEYMTYFHQDFLGVTGPENQLKKMTKPLGIFYEKNSPDNEGNYSINHTTAILLVDPQARVRSLTSAPHNANTIAKDYHYVLAN